MRLQGAFYNFVSSISSGQSATPAPQWRAPQKVKNLTANPSSYYAHITWSRPETDEEVGSSLFNDKDAVLLNNNEPNSVVRYWWRLYECTCGLCDDYNWSCNSIVTTEDVNLNNIAGSFREYRITDTIQVGKDSVGNQKVPDNIKLASSMELNPLTHYKFSVKTRTQYGDSKPTSVVFKTFGPRAEQRDTPELSYVETDTFRLNNHNPALRYDLIDNDGIAHEVFPAGYSDQTENYFVVTNEGYGESYLRVTGESGGQAFYTPFGTARYTYRYGVIYRSPYHCNCTQPTCFGPDGNAVTPAAGEEIGTSAGCGPGLINYGHTCVKEPITDGHRLFCELDCPTYWPVPGHPKHGYCAVYDCRPPQAPSVEPATDPILIICPGISCDTCWKDWYGYIKNGPPAGYYRDSGSQWFFVKNGYLGAPVRKKYEIPENPPDFDDTLPKFAERDFAVDFSALGVDDLPAPADWPNALLFPFSSAPQFEDTPKVTEFWLVENPEDLENSEMQPLAGLQDIFVTIYDKDGDEVSYHALTENDASIRFGYYKNGIPIGFGPQTDYKDETKEDGWYVTISVPEKDGAFSFSVEFVFLPGIVTSDNEVHSFFDTEEYNSATQRVAQRHGIMVETSKNVMRLKRR